MQIDRAAAGYEAANPVEASGKRLSYHHTGLPCDRSLVRVFRRVGFVEGDSANEANRATRRLNPEFPGQLDWPAWRIGQQWCHAVSGAVGGKGGRVCRTAGGQT